MRRAHGVPLAAALLLTLVGCAGEPDIAPSPEPVATSDEAADTDEAADGDEAAADDAPVPARERRRAVADDPRVANADLIDAVEDLFGTATTSALDEECSTVPGEAPDDLGLEPTGRHQLLTSVSDTSGEVDPAELVARLETEGIDRVAVPNPDVTLFEGDLEDGGTVSVVTFGGDLSVFLVWTITDPDDEALADLTWRSCAEQQEELFPAT